MKMSIEIEETEAYEIGFKHGLEIGVDLNPFNKDLERYCYEKGYSAGVREYCENDKYPEDKKCLTS
jgi:hypothetical protein